MIAAVRREGELGRAALLTFGLWLMVWGFWALGELAAGRAGFVREAPIDLSVTLVKAALALSLYPLCLRSHSWPGPRRWLLIVGSVLLIAIVQALVEVGEVKLLRLWSGWSSADRWTMRTWIIASLLNNGYVSFATAALLAFQVEMRCTSEQKIKLADAEAIAQRAQNDALRLQLNPHFLFNTLNSISSLMVTRRIADAEEMLARLADFLRGSLATAPDRVVTLDEETEAVETYLQIEQVRFGDRMRIAITYPPELSDVLVPSFILQPLVENAVKYGVATTQGVVTVKVAAEARNGTIELVVSDDGDAPMIGEPAFGLGVGLANTRQRLELLYGREARLRAGKEDRSYVARLRLPLRRS